MVLGLLMVGALYLGINAVYLYALPMTEIAANTAVAQAAAVSMFSAGAARSLALMTSVSCFGAAGPPITCAAPAYYATAANRGFFFSLAKVSPPRRTPGKRLA